jgi:hypothetical protein
MLTDKDVAHRMAIIEKIYRYCRAIDRLDVALGYTVFHADSRAIFPNFDSTGHAWIDAVCEAHLKFLCTSHQVTNVITEIVGDRAGSESYVMANLRMADGEKAFQREYWCRYVDRWSRRADEWKIHERECIVDFCSTREVNPIFESNRTKRSARDPSYVVLSSTDTTNR